MADDLDALTTSLRADPRDPITIQALADWLEEKGAAPESVRALTVEGPTLLFFGWPEGASVEMIKRIEELAKWTADQIRATSDQKVGWVALPANVTIRAIKARQAEASGAGG